MRFTSFIVVCLTLLVANTRSLAQFGDDLATQSPTSTGSLDNLAAELSSDEEFLPVEKAYILNAEFEANEQNEFSQLRLNWQIANGYYLYRHGFAFKLLTENQPEQDLTASAVIPDGKAKNDDYFGRVEVYYHNIDITLKALPKNAAVTLAATSQGCADAGLCYPPRTQYFKLDTRNATIAATENPKSSPNTDSSNITNRNDANNKPIGNAEQSSRHDQSSKSLPYMLILAVLGGAILNLMPCVFPVLSLKILSFANDKDHSTLVHGSVYSVGVVISFVVVAAVLISLQAAGDAVGWGFHLQSPWFVAALAYLFFVMGLSLSGFIELGSGWMNAGNSLASKSGYGGSFFTGVLATVVASPCTAPFMGTALGYAVTQPTLIALSVFAALGFGMSLPVLLLSCSPALLNKIPKPGPWMVHLKEFLAFPLYVTAIWLCWVVGRQSGVNAMASILMGCVMITLALWLWRGGVIKRSLSAAAAAVAIAVLASPFLTPSANPADSTAQWQAYSPETLSQLRQQGKPVFINVTADWCITCLANEKVTLSTDRVKQAFIDSGVTYLKGDWTKHDSTITDLLKQHGRTGIPLYLVYPSDSSKGATLLPQILTADLVVEALKHAENPAI
jgi:thiol:disulfide interchange protein